MQIIVLLCVMNSFLLWTGISSQEQETPLRIGASRPNAGGSIRVANSDVPTSPVIPSTSPASAHLHDIDLSSPLNYGTPSSMGSVRTPRSGVRGTWNLLWKSSLDAIIEKCFTFSFHARCFLWFLYRHTFADAPRYSYWRTNASSKSKLRYGKLRKNIQDLERH